MSKHIVEEWLERGKQDWEVAKILFTKGVFLNAVLFHLQQTIEKYLKGFLIHNGWKLKKIHDLELLLTDASNFNGLFNNYLDLGRKLTASYFEERYPPGPITTYSKKEINEIIREGKEIILNIEELLNIRKISKKKVKAKLGKKRKKKKSPK